jgi:hypothetical protein
MCGSRLKSGPSRRSLPRGIRIADQIKSRIQASGHPAGLEDVTTARTGLAGEVLDEIRAEYDVPCQRGSDDGGGARFWRSAILRPGPCELLVSA